MINNNNKSLIVLLQNMAIEALADSLLACNDITGQYGLFLSEEQVRALIQNNFDALNATGRIEFSQGVVGKLIMAFYDSPYVFRHNYECILSDLTDIFYYFKNESGGMITDDELIAFMRLHFDTVCAGSIEQLSAFSLEELCRSQRMKQTPLYDEAPAPSLPEADEMDIYDQFLNLE